MMPLDERAGHAARSVHSIFEFDEIPEPPAQHSASTRRWVLAAGIAAIAAVAVGGLALAADDETPSTEPQSDDRHYGIDALPEGWRRNVIPTQGVDTSAGRTVMTLINTGRGLVGIHTSPSIDAEQAVPDGAEVVRMGSAASPASTDLAVYVVESGTTTAARAAVWELHWQQDQLDATATAVSKDAALELIPGLIRDGDTLVPMSNAFGVVVHTGSAGLIQAVFSPVLSARPLPIDELTSYAPPSGQYGLALSVLRTDADNAAAQMLFDFVIETSGLTKTSTGAFLETGDPAGRLDVALRWVDGGDLVVASGVGFPEGEFTALVEQIGDVDDATWRRWIDASDPPPPGIEIDGGQVTVETAVAGTAPQDPNDPNVAQTVPTPTETAITGG